MPFVLLYVVLEVLAIVALASWIGAGWTVLVLLGGSLLGMLLARREGVRAARALATAVQHGKIAHAEATDGLLVALAGVLLFLPGLITDLLGLALVFPPTRALARRRLVDAAERRAPGLRTARIRYGATVVDGEAVGPDGASREPRQYPTITGPASGAGGPAAGSGPAGAGGGGPVIEGEIVDDPPRRDS